MRGVTWKQQKSTCMWVGTVKGDTDYTLIVQGRGCVTDVRASRKLKEFIHPNHYKISSVEEGKRLAEDLVNGDNFELHEKNRLAYIAETKRQAKVIEDTEKFIYNLKLKEALKR